MGWRGFVAAPSTHLDAEDAEDDEKGAADEHNVSYRSERGQQRLYHQLQTWCTAYHPANTNSIIVRHGDVMVRSLALQGHSWPRDTGFPNLAPTRMTGEVLTDPTRKY